MGELVVSPDAEQIFIDYLRGGLLDQGFNVPVAGKVIAGAESLTVFATGGPGRQTHRSSSKQLTVDSRAALESRAGGIARMVDALMFAASGQVLAGHQIYSVISFADPGNLPDPNAQSSARYRQSFEIHIESTVLSD